MYICPLCKNQLKRYDKVLRCSNNHSFDFSASGYVNLLVSNNSKFHGDDKIMVDARRSFLSKGYYEPLCFQICKNIFDIKNQKNTKTLLDIGCGEGYYTSAIVDYFKSQNEKIDIYGIDISKKAAEKAAKKNKNIKVSVASAYELPFDDESFDIATNIFSPYSNDENLRVLKKGGFLILVIPAPEHLLELKRAVYDSIKIKPVMEYNLEGFSFIKKQLVNFEMNLEDYNDIDNLFKMTPYYYKTSKENYKRLEKYSSMKIGASFQILNYIKK